MELSAELSPVGHYQAEGDWSPLKVLVEIGDLTWSGESGRCVSEASIN